MPSPDVDLIPQYRLRLFLSADLAGSTAFKAGVGAKPAGDSASQPVWVKATRDFYLKFPEFLSQNYHLLHREHLASSCPRVWKTVGDEIIFCSRLIDSQHLRQSMTAFLGALRDYGKRLDGQQIHLDVKGAAWVAAFPSPNFTVKLEGGSYDADQFDEKFEVTADGDPKRVDFLGRDIDCGFRVSAQAAVDRCALSFELAYLLADPVTNSTFSGRFCDYSKVVLKGVLKNRPYPIFYLDTERNEARRRVNHHEKEITGAKPPTAFHVRDFLQHFMIAEKLEFPALAHPGEPLSDFPATYMAFQDAWRRDVQGLIEQRKNEETAEIEANGGGNEQIPDEVQAQARILTTEAEVIANTASVLDSD